MSKVYPLKENQAHAVHPQRTVWQIGRAHV